MPAARSLKDSTSQQAKSLGLGRFMVPAGGSERIPDLDAVVVEALILRTTGAEETVAVGQMLEGGDDAPPRKRNEAHRPAGMEQRITAE